LRKGDTDMAKEPKKLIANNKKVYHDYFLLEKYEAGISLAGTEVKSLRMGRGSIKESFIRIENGEIILYGMHITPYEKGNIFNKDPLRPKKLLLHKKEIEKLSSKMKEKGFTIVPVEVYFKGSLVKVEIALAKGKKLYESRHSQEGSKARGTERFQNQKSGLVKNEYGLVKVSTGYMQLEKRVVWRCVKWPN
jgi:SsrA-binding protein